MTKPAIGFIGLGLMGSAICERLLDLGYPLTIVANRSRQRVEAAVARGAVEVGTARQVAEASDFVILITQIVNQPVCLCTSIQRVVTSATKQRV